ncbi:PREDICTED: uncharacterized SDCCAG3 family protein [Nicrophorus vespilloides]|uniref:Uncharacterized SDCCAG3 family protein n=1 Tax=Nicrophorus vespilloides TaxID=110193 RepID=A0ABM1M8Z7_NICVS|nr:PREDICTED: uncharacterized SDCCAG3 family protein [Nicrophorus vespilloides]
MVGSNGTMMAIRIVRSKLRKREEHSNSVHPADVVLQTSPAPPPSSHNLHNNHLNNNNNNHHHHQQQALGGATTTTAPSNAIVNPSNNDLAYRGQFLWQTPPPPTQQHLYNNNQDALVQGLPTTERTGFVRGFRKNLGGRWRRLVKRKPETEVYTIPAELKPQLKQIYVY